MQRLSILTLTLLLTACGGPSEEPPEGADTRNRPGAPSPNAGVAEPPGEPPDGAAAVLAPTQGNEASGTLAIARSPEGLRITGAIQGLKADSQFGFHIHEKGDCSAPDAGSAGAHFNPDKQPHGNPETGAHHAGDMVNVRSDSEGVAAVDTTVKNVNLHTSEPNDVIGKAIIVHESPDDYTTQPSGNSGARIACGVIAVTSGDADEADTGR